MADPVARCAGVDRSNQNINRRQTMRSVVSTEEGSKVSKGLTPAWDEAQMWRRTRRWFVVLAGVIVGLWVFLVGWVFFIAPITDAEAKVLPIGADVALALAPVIAAAAGVERVLETVFNMIEGTWRAGVAYLGYGFRWLKSAQTELAEARQWMQSIGAYYNGTVAANNQEMTLIFEDHKRKMVETLQETADAAPDPRLKDALQQAAQQVNALPAEMLSKMTELLVTPPDLPLPAEVLQKINQVRETLLKNINALREGATAKLQAAEALLGDAQNRLKEAEAKLATATSSSDYRSAKSAATIILGLMLGVVIAAVGQIQMFALLGIGTVPARIDVLITGLVIGSGAYPVHSLVGILQKGKDALDGLGSFLNGRAAPQVKAVEQKITTIQPTAPGQPPLVGQAVIQTTSAQAPEPTAGG
jgi:exonuclease VII small subunit